MYLTHCPTLLAFWREILTTHADVKRSVPIIHSGPVFKQLFGQMSISVSKWHKIEAAVCRINWYAVMHVLFNSYVRTE